MLKGGRPSSRTKPSLETIAKISETTSIRQMAILYGVSTATISRWRREAFAVIATTDDKKEVC